MKHLVRTFAECIRVLMNLNLSQLSRKKKNEKYQTQDDSIKNSIYTIR